VEWLIGTLTDLIHAASRQVTAGAMSPAEAERVLLRTAGAALVSHQRRPGGDRRRATKDRADAP
jgi:hypothetical protein